MSGTGRVVFIGRESEDMQCAMHHAPMQVRFSVRYIGCGTNLCAFSGVHGMKRKGCAAWGKSPGVIGVGVIGKSVASQAARKMDVGKVFGCGGDYGDHVFFFLVFSMVGDVYLFCRGRFGGEPWSCRRWRGNILCLRMML